MLTVEWKGYHTEAHCTVETTVVESDGHGLDHLSPAVTVVVFSRPVDADGHHSGCVFLRAVAPGHGPSLPATAVHSPVCIKVVLGLPLPL